jgi:hypothetical protein
MSGMSARKSSRSGQESKEFKRGVHCDAQGELMRDPLSCGFLVISLVRADFS